MSTEAQLLANGIAEAWNAKDWELLRSYHADNWIDHTAPPEMNDLTAFQGLFDVFTNAFPDLTVEIPKTIDCGDEIAYMYRITGTHTGEFMGVPASGNAVDFRGIALLTISDGKCREVWQSMDMMTLMQQIGAIPATG